MRHCSAIFLYLGFVFLPGALIAPWIYEFTHWMTCHSPEFASLADKPFHRFVSRSLLLMALLAAATVSLLEELLFRGAIFGELRKSLSWPAVLVVSNLLYAALHFIDRAAPTPSIDRASGLIPLASMLSSFGHPEKLMPGLMNLALAGAILGTAYQRTGALYLPIGLHAGWIFRIKSCGFFIKKHGLETHWFWGSHKLIDGWVATPDPTRT